MEFKIYRSNEAELIRRCIRRERDAQKRLYDMYSPLLYPICCRYVKSSMEAEDILVVAFAKILDKIAQYKSEGSFEGWMKRIVINEALTHLRSQRSLIIVTDPEEIADTNENTFTHDHLEEEDL